MCKPPENHPPTAHPLPDFDAVDPSAHLAGYAEGPVSPDLPSCPDCTGLLQFSSASGMIGRPACGWQIVLAPDDRFELTKALLGLSDIPASVLWPLLVQARISST